LKRFLTSCLLMLASSVGVQAQAIRTNVIGVHDMGPFGQSPITGGLTTCQYCHAPHSGLHGVAPLWSQKLSTQTNYTLYSSGSLVNLVQEPVLGSASNLCLSCHDGTVAPGQTTPSGSIRMSGSMFSQDIFGTDLSTTHPFNFKLPLSSNTPNVYPSLMSSGTTANSAVKLINGNVQCTSCHEPHVQSIDPVANAFLVVDNSGSNLCLACHEATPTQTDPHQMAQPGTTGAKSAGKSTSIAKYNVLNLWARSAHSTTTYKVAKGVKNMGPYGDTRRNACLSCHATHQGSGGASLLNGPAQPLQNVDKIAQNCSSCHNGGTNLSPAIPNIFAEFTKMAGHPLQSGTTGKHDLKEAVMVNNNRHSTCVDCHDPHSSRPTTSFVMTSIRPSQQGAMGVSATDGATVLAPAANQYETCLRCHGNSSGKQILTVFGYLPVRAATAGDILNILPQFSTNAKSSHPVMHDRTSSLPQPSLLKAMWNLDGHTQGRLIDNREFGGSGPNGPHGSKYSHILERRYEFSQVAPGTYPAGGPGTTIQNLIPPVVDPAAGGPYSLCAKCHDLSNVMSNASFSKHALHINAGFSCSVCHAAHGVALASSGTTGERLVNFDLAVVAPNNTSNAPVSYNHTTNTCALKCHNYNHYANGTVAPATNVRAVGKAGH
jgi:predicted CXXCH cytochrome family protein